MIVLIEKMEAMARPVEAEDAEELQKTIDSVLGNSLVVGLICSHTESVKDLRNFRLVNRLFHNEASKRLRSVHEPIDLLYEVKLMSFLQTMRARFDPENSTFPFASFRLHLRLSVECLKLFVKEFGEFIHHLELELSTAFSKYDEELNSCPVKDRLAVIFSYTRYLEHFQLRTNVPVHLHPRDLAVLPTSFPRLRSIHIDYFKEAQNASPFCIPLLSYLITRAQVLEDVHVPRIGEMPGQNDAMSALRLIAQHHRDHLPHISLSKSSILPATLPALRELNEMGLPLDEFSVELRDRFIDTEDLPAEAEAQNIMNCVTWLEAQSSTVTSLCVQLWKPRCPFTFSIPVLAALKELNLVCWAFDVNDECPILPLVPNHFASLRKLTLDHYRDSFGIFDNCYLPSVELLHIENQLTPLTAPWHTILPNLTSLHFEVSYDTFEADGLNLAYLLNHFPRIIHLELNLGKEQDFWDILTGGAPRPASSHDLLQGVLGGDVGQLEEPSDGVYQTASLRNFRALKTLRCWPGTRANLDAILYMTRAGLLVPLEQIELHGINAKVFQIKHEEGALYTAELCKVHSHLNFCLKQSK